MESVETEFEPDLSSAELGGVSSVLRWNSGKADGSLCTTRACANNLTAYWVHIYHRLTNPIKYLQSAMGRSDVWAILKNVDYSDVFKETP